jgi:predicted nucleotidyltransferase
MRQVTFKGSAKAFFLDRDALLKRLRVNAQEAIRRFPEITEVLLFGSLAHDTQTGLSDIDLAVVLAASAAGADPLERARPFHLFFQQRLDIAVDVLVFTETDRPQMRAFLQTAASLAARVSGAHSSPRLSAAPA